MTSIGVIRKIACDKCASHCGITSDDRDKLESVCPIGSWSVISIESVPTAPKKKCSGLKLNPLGSIAKEGPKLWETLHRRALAYECRPIEEIQWLKAFEAAIPCGKCRNHWRELIRTTPPTLKDSDEYFSWTVSIHNMVNTSKEYPSQEISLEAARLLWN